MSKGGSKVLTAIISFFLGFFFAILVEVGAIFGVYWIVMNKDLESIMSAVGLHNTDENGNHKYINTDPDGGATTLKELIASLQGLVYSDGEIVALGKSFDDFSQLVPATDMLLGFVYNTIDGYIELDKELFESTPLSGLAQVLSDSIMDVRTAALLQKLGMNSVIGEDANAIVRSLVAGAECEYANVITAQPQSEDGEISQAKGFALPVLYDFYRYDESNGFFYNCVDNASAFPDNLRDRANELLYEEERKDSEGKVISTHTLYYVPCRVTENGIEEAEYSIGEISVTDGTGGAAKIYKFQVLEYGEDTDFIAVTRKNGKFHINYNDVYAMLDVDAANRSYRFTGYSYDQSYARKYYYDPVKNASADRYEFKTISGKNYFRDNDGNFVDLNPLTLRDIVNDPFTPLDYVPLTDVVGENSDIAYDIFGNTSLGALMRGEVDFDELVNDMEVGTFVNNVAPSNKVMAYIVYKLSDLERKDNGEYTAIFDKYGENKAVTVTVENGYISGVYDAADNTEIKDMVKIHEVADVANTMPITVLMSARIDEAVTMYIAYGAYGLKSAEAGATDQTGKPYAYTAKVKADGEEVLCYVSTEMKGEGGDAVETVTSVWYIQDGEPVEVRGTKVSEVSSRVDTFTKDLTIGDMLGIENTENKLLGAIKDSKIDELENKIQELKVDDIISEEDLNKSSILRQLKGKKISNLANEIDSVLIQRVYAEEVYGLKDADDLDPKVTDEWHENRLYYVLDEETGAFSLYDTEAQKAKAQAAAQGKSEAEQETAYDDALGHIGEDDFVPGKYYTYGEAKGMWRLILYKNDSEKAYTMNNFNNMIASSAHNINNATLGTLQEAGIISATADLDKTFNGYVLKDLTLAQLIVLVSA